MRLLGTVIGLSASGRLLLRVSGGLHLRIGQPVFSGKSKIGRIYDVVGPVAKPWVLVDVLGDPGRFVGSKLYLR